MKNISIIVLGLIISILLFSCEYQANKACEKKRYEPELAEADSIVVVIYKPASNGYITCSLDSAYVISNPQWISLITMHLNDSTRDYYSCCGNNGEMYGLLNNKMIFFKELNFTGQVHEIFDFNKIFIIPEGYQFVSYINRRQWNMAIKKSRKLFQKQYFTNDNKKVRSLISFCESNFLPIHCPNMVLCLNYDGYCLIETENVSIDCSDIFLILRNNFKKTFEVEKDTLLSVDNRNIFKIYCNKEEYDQFVSFKKMSSFLYFTSELKVFNYSNDFSEIDKIIQ